MRDVFEYFKFLSEAKKSAAAEKAAELGYVHQSHGIYLDPRTNKYYKSENGQLVPHEMKTPGEKGPGAEEPQGGGQPSLSQFQQQAAKRTDLGSDVPSESPLEDPEVRNTMIMTLAKNESTPRRWETLDSTTQKRNIAIATVKYDDILARRAAAAQAAMVEPEPEPEPEPVEEPKKEPKDFKQLEAEAEKALKQIQKKPAAKKKSTPKKKAEPKPKKEKTKITTLVGRLLGDDAITEQDFDYIEKSRDPVPEPKINNWKEQGNAGNLPGKSTKVEKYENATMEVMNEVFNNEQILRDAAGNYNQNLINSLSKYDISEGDAITAAKTANALRKYIGNIVPGEYAFGKMGGQSTDIPDENRSNLYDDVIGKLYDGLGRMSPEFKKPSTKRGRDTSKNNGYNDDEISNFGKKIASKIYGADSSSGTLDDIIQSGDVYMNRKGIEEEIMKDIDEIGKAFEDGDIDPVHYVNSIRYLMSERFKNNDILPISLKKILKDTKNKQHDPKVVAENISVDDWLEYVNQDFNDPGVRLDFLNPISGVNDFFGTSSMGMSFDSDSTGNWRDQNRQYTKPAKFTGTMRSDSDAYKIEPVSPTNRGNLDARMGLVPQKYTQDLMTKITGNDFDHMIPRAGTDKDKVGGKLRPGGKQERFEKKHYDFWTKRIEEMMKYKGKKGLEITPESLSIGDSKNLSPQEYVTKLFDIANLDEEQLGGRDTKFDRGDDAKKYDKYQSRKRVNGALKNLHLLNMMQKADSNDELKKTLFDLITRSNKINTSENDLAFPRLSPS